jgi:murein L,D-transpeptidase YcbB/YkuD
MAVARRWLVASACALLAALAGGGSGAVGPDVPLEPTARGVAGLETARAAFLAAAGDDSPPPLGRGPTLAQGDRAPEVALLRVRLASAGAPSNGAGDPQLFDATLDAAVREFQRRHGLEPDGKVGPATRAELDLGPLDRARQIERVIAARRTLPADLGARYLLVNLPAFELEAVDRERPGLRLRVVVGRVDRPTPTLAAAVRSIVVHPAWNVPPRIAREEIAARARRDPGYLARLDFEVLAAGGGAAVDPAGVDWRAFERRELDLSLRQRPGPLNALGAVAFQFPNPHNVALHDTPEQRLFERARRSFSHACMRVERARELARWLVAGEPPGAATALERAFTDVEVTRELPLAAPVPIYVVDWPVWVDADGVLQLRPELYPAATPIGSGECADAIAR